MFQNNSRVNPGMPPQGSPPEVGTSNQQQDNAAFDVSAL